MRTFDQWMDEYGVSHQNPTNQLVHKVCVPLIMWTVLAFLWCLPVPTVLKFFPLFNWATFFMAICLVFYLSLNFLMFVGMLIQGSIMCWICYEINKTEMLVPIAAVVFVLAWIGQFWGHKIEGKKPSFLQDVVFLLIGPMWVLRFLYKKLGIAV